MGRLSGSGNHDPVELPRSVWYVEDGPFDEKGNRLPWDGKTEFHLAIPFTQVEIWMLSRGMVPAELKRACEKMLEPFQGNAGGAGGAPGSGASTGSVAGSAGDATSPTKPSR